MRRCGVSRVSARPPSPPREQPAVGRHPQPAAAAQAVTPAALELARRVQFGRRLRQLRDRAGYAPDQVAAAAGLDPAGYADLEHGQRLPDLDTTYALADALGVHITELFGTAGPRRAP